MNSRLVGKFHRLRLPAFAIAVGGEYTSRLDCVRLPMMHKCLSLLLLLTLLGVGCENGADLPRPPFSGDGEYLPAAAGPGVVADPDSLIPDVPTPIGFKVLPSRSSNAVMQGNARQVRHVYQGRAEPAEVVLMYRHHLPRHHWQFVSREEDDDGAAGASAIPKGLSACEFVWPSVGRLRR